VTSLGRSLAHLIELLHSLAARGVQFRSLTEHIDTTKPTRKHKRKRNRVLWSKDSLK
jgi:DNA invertase Pin-like site-specific DNA recombinase